MQIINLKGMNRKQVSEVIYQIGWENVDQTHYPLTRTLCLKESGYEYRAIKGCCGLCGDNYLIQKRKRS